jgi:hypothetical protein
MPTDIAFAIVPKSDQINADDLIAGPIVVRLGRCKAVKVGEQPVEIDIEDVTGTFRKPWRPCKTMLRLMTEAWQSSDADTWRGRYVRLVRDPSVRFGGSEVGGIRVSGLSDIPGNMTAQVTVSKGKRAPYRVEKLTPPAPASTSTAAQRATDSDPLAGFRAHLTRLTLDPAAVIEWIATLGQDAAALSPDDRRGWVIDLTDPDGSARTDYAAWLASRSTTAP